MADWTTTNVMASVSLTAALDAIERITEATDHPTLISEAVVVRIEKVAARIRELQAKRKAEPRTCGSCGCYIHECECN